MPINILADQRQHAQVGRIRIGKTVPTQSGKTRPEKIDRFRITTPAEHLARQIADLYGGEPKLWNPQGGGAQQWEVFTEAKMLDVVVPPKAMTQWLEHWQGPSCALRCDGIREMLKDQPCVCGPDPEARKCKPTTRVNLMLARIPTIGVWRLETHGYYAAVQIPPVVELLQSMGGYQPAALTLVAASRTVDGKKKSWFVPQLDITHAPAAAIMGTGVHLGIETANAGRPAIGAGLTPVDGSPASAPEDDDDTIPGEVVDDQPAASAPTPAAEPETARIVDAIAAVVTRVELTELRKTIAERGKLTPAINDALKARWNALPSGRQANAPTSGAPAGRPAPASEPAPVRADPVVTEPAPVAEPEPVAEPAPAAAPRTDAKAREAAFMPVAMAAAQAGWNNARIQDEFARQYGHSVSDGTAAEFGDFLQHVK